MKLTPGLFLFLVAATTVLLLSEGALAAGASKRQKKERRRQQTVVDNTLSTGDEAAADTVHLATAVDQPAPDNAVAEEEGAGLLDITPTDEHNGKINRKRLNKEAKKLQRQTVRKAERKQAQLDNNEDSAADVLTKKQLKKQAKKQSKKAKKAARKEMRKLQKQEAGAEMVSFDDIVQEMHGDPIPNPIPPVEGAATEGQDTAAAAIRSQKLDGRAAANNAGAGNGRQAQRRRERKERNHRGRTKGTCESSSDCNPGHCCVERKGLKYCKPSTKKEGHKCIDDCMCRADLVCVSEVVAPGKEKGFCRASDPQVHTDTRTEGIEGAAGVARDTNE